MIALMVKFITTSLAKEKGLVTKCFETCNIILSYLVHCSCANEFRPIQADSKLGTEVDTLIRVYFYNFVQMLGSLMRWENHEAKEENQE